MLTTIHAVNGDHGGEVYRYLLDELGATFVQYIPIIERAIPESLPIADAGWGSHVPGRHLYRHRRFPGEHLPLTLAVVRFRVSTCPTRVIASSITASHIQSNQPHRVTLTATSRALARRVLGWVAGVCGTRGRPFLMGSPRLDPPVGSRSARRVREPERRR